MDNDFIRDIIKDVVFLLMEEELLECNEDTTKEDYIHAIEEMTDVNLKKITKEGTSTEEKEKMIISLI